jgi:hypothetical protein
MRRAIFAVLLFCACDDPVHSGQVDALGGENGGTGPTHRPGQPCLACHGGSGPASGQFAFGGTVYKEDKDEGFPNVDVKLTDAKGVVKDVITNSAGNFYIRHEAWEPTYPVHVQISLKDPAGGPDVVAQMGTHVGRDGSCAACHYEPKGPSSAGHVVLSEPDTSGGDAGP